MSHPPTFAVAIAAFLALATIAEALHSAQHARSALISTASSWHLSQTPASFE